MRYRPYITAFLSLAITSAASPALGQPAHPSQDGPPAAEPPAVPIKPIEEANQLACYPDDPRCNDEPQIRPIDPVPRVRDVEFGGMTLYDGCTPYKHGFTGVGYCYDGNFVGPVFLGSLISISDRDDSNRTLRVFGLGQVGLLNMVGTYEGLVRVSATGNVSDVSHSIDIGIANLARDEAYGMQFGFFNYAGEMVGIQYGSLSFAGNFKGLQVSGLGMVSGSMMGLQVVAAGRADEMFGAQLGAVVSSEDFTGVRVAGIGITSRRFIGLSIGGGNFVTHGDASGVFVGGLNIAGESMDGGMFGVGNVTTGEMSGLQFGAINYAGPLDGVQLGALNLTHDRIHGIQLGAFNYGYDNAGIQAGAINVDGGEMSLLQMGIINIAAKLTGVQLGLLNISAEGGLPFMIFANAG